MKKLFAALSLMMVFALFFASCGNSKVNKAYSDAVVWSKAEDKDPGSSKTNELFKKYISSLSELNKEERGQLVEKLKKAKLDKCATIAKIDVQKAKKIIDSLEDATTDGMNKFLDVVESGIESFDTEALESALEKFGNSAEATGDAVGSAIDDFSSSLETALDGIDTDELDSEISSALEGVLSGLDSIGSKNSSDSDDD
ncbi:MAG: hypothetical protein K6E22_09390 [Treponema sp.]|nr:hypothetical protein [Treponema sp.]